MWEKVFLKKVAVLFMVSMMFGGNLLGNLNETTLTESLKVFYKDISNPTKIANDKVIESLSNLMLAVALTVIKDGGKDIRKDTMKNAIRDRLSDSLKSIKLNELALDSLKAIAIDLVSEDVIRRTGSRAAGGTMWFTLKQADALINAANKGNNPLTFKVALAYEEASLLGDVIVKNVEEYKNLKNDSKNSIKSDMINTLSKKMELFTVTSSSKGTVGDLMRDYYRSSDSIKKQEILNQLKTEMRNSLAMYLNNPKYHNQANDFLNEWNANLENKLLTSKINAYANINAAIDSGNSDKAASIIELFATQSQVNEFFKKYDNTQNSPIMKTVYIDNEKEIIALSSVEKKEPEIISYTITNPESQIDSNKEKLAQLEKKEGKLNSKIGDINEKESDIKDKKAKLNNLNNQLNNSNNSSSKAEIDSKKFAFLLQAKELVEKYGDIPLNQWDNKDRVKLGILAKNLDIGFGDGIIGKATYLRTQLRLGKFSYLRDTFATNIIEVSNYNNYSSIEKEIQLLTQKIKKENQELTLLKLDKNKLEIETSNLTDDYNNDFKKEIAHTNTPNTNTSTHESWWSGNYTKVFYGENHLGEPSFGGYGDGEAETKEYKPTAGTKLYLNEINNEGNTVKTLTSSESSYFGSYDYVAWGTWSDSTAINQVYTSHWVVVDQLDRDQIPKQGSATYKGELAGGQWNIGQTGYNSVNGDINLNANFGTNNISGNLNVKNVSNNSTWATASFNSSMSSGSDGDGLSFKGNLTGAGISNQETWHSQINGSFGGNQAAEVGGVWAITKGTGSNGDGRAVGVFRAKKQ